MTNIITVSIVFCVLSASLVLWPPLRASPSRLGMVEHAAAVADIGDRAGKAIPIP